MAGRTRMARNLERIFAVGLPLVFLLPWRQVTRRSACLPAARARSSRVGACHRRNVVWADVPSPNRQGCIGVASPR